MTREDIEMVRGFYEAWNNKEIPTMLALLEDADFEFVEPPEFPGARSFVGRSAFAGALGRQLDTRGEFKMECDDVTEAPDGQLLAEVREVSLGERSIEHEETFFHVWKLRDGKLLQLKVFVKKANALAATGMLDDELHGHGPEPDR
jgi:ketosteroid isomerase-like protein